MHVGKAIRSVKAKEYDHKNKDTYTTENGSQKLASGLLFHNFVNYRSPPHI